MSVQSKMPTRRQWTSLSVLAGAAFAGGPATAYATIVSHGPAAFPVSLPGGNSITVSRSNSGWTTSTGLSTRNFKEKLTLRHHPYVARLVGVTFAAHLAEKGQTFNQIGSGNGPSADRLVRTRRERLTATINASHPNFYTVRNFVADRMAFATRNYVFSTLRTAHNVTGFRASGSQIQSSTYPPPYSDAYALFRFNTGSQTDYGWLELSLSYPTTGWPDFTISAYAYDTSGNPLPAGSVPEPQELPLAMGALALGALGVREWRKGRRNPEA